MSVEQKIEVFKLIILIISGAAIPIVIFVVGNRYTKAREMEEKLRSERIDIYYKILEPFFLIFGTEAQIKASMKSQKDRSKSGADLAAEKVLKLEYQDYAFKLSLIGSDSVVKAFNNLMQAYYNSEKIKDEDSGIALIKYMAVLLFEIRKSLGNEKSKINPLEMLEWKITDLRDFKQDGNYPDMSKYY